MSDFVHLHVHTQYSLLDGFSHIPKLIDRAKELDMPALGITDHGTLFGVIDFFNAAKKGGVKPLIGVEAYMAARTMKDRDSQKDRKSSHLLLLAENQTGYQNLLKIASAAQLEGFYYYPRIDHEFLAAHSEGLIATSGCMSAEIPRAIVQENPEAAVRKLDWYYEVFGPDNFFIELQSHDIEEIPKLNKTLIEMGNRHNAKFVATNDVHYINQEDARLQDIMLCVQTGSLLSDPKRMKMSGDSFYLKSGREMATLFSDVPGALSNTLMIAERCNVDLSSDGYKLPKFEVPEGYTVKSYLRELCEEGLEQRYGSHKEDKVIRERLEYELGVIDEMGFNAYFLIVWDLCRFARDEGIWYNARGSAAGSIVGYTLDITLVDPIEHELIFERFLNPGRVSMPDIDLDFQDDQRYRLMEYCAQEYGDDKVASIITFGKMKARAAVRDVGRVMDIPLSEVDKVAKMIPNIPGNPVTISEALEQVPDLKQEYNSKSFVKNLLDIAMKIEGSLRNAGTHAAGVVITDKPVVDYIPLHRPTGSSGDSAISAVTQFEMSTIDSLGLLKVDFLGLSTLTIMQRACRLIKERHNIELDLHSIPLDDEATYEMLGKGETAGVFQLEGSGMSRWVMEMKPKNLGHVTAMVALYRPGPMDFIPSFIARMHGREDVSYRHEMLEPILKETFGITVYQEQIMYTAMNLGGYTASEADFLRKTVAKKKEKELKENREKFVSGASKRGVPEGTANLIFDDWEAFARYGFPKGHAADYAVISVETAYLKCNYPVEYMAALLSVVKNDSDKVAMYSTDCRKNLGIEILAPDINSSVWDFSIEDEPDGKSNIRFGLGAIKNVGVGPVEELIRGREDGKFEDLTDLANRVDLRKVGKRALESMIKAGGLDSFGPRMALLQVMEQAIALSGSQFLAADMGQMTFFGADSGLSQKIGLPDVDPEYNRREQLNWERDLIGMFVSDHPLTPIMKDLAEVVSHTSSQLKRADHQEIVRVAGMVSKVRPHVTKKGSSMAFVGIEDTEGVIDLVVFPRTWKQYGEIIEFDKVIIVEGKVDAEGSDPKILVDKIKTEIDIVKPLVKPKEELSKKPNAEKQSNEKLEPMIPPQAPSIPNNVLAEEAEDYFLDPDMPPPPDPFEDDWLEQWVDEPVTVDEVVSNEPVLAQPEEKEADFEEQTESMFEPTPTSEVEPVKESPPKDEKKNKVIGMSIPKPSRPGIIPPPEARPQPYMVTVVLRTMGDKARDILRMRRIHGMLISYPGKDKLAFYVIERNSGYRLEFPNDTTEINDELVARLEEVVGAENVIIEQIMFQ